MAPAASSCPLSGLAGPGGRTPGQRTLGPAAPPSYLPALDGLRAGAVLLVVAAHAGLERVVPGGFGVTLFFALSGFLITRQLLAEHARTGRIGFGGFYLRRLLRLVPAGLAYVLVAGGVFVWAGGALSPGGWAAAALQGANYWQLVGGFRSTLAGVRHPFSILWSLAVEDHFYLLWPALLALLLRRHGRGLAWATGAALLLCAGALAWRATLFGACFPAGHAPALRPLACLPPASNPAYRFYRLYMATDTRLDSLAWGVLPALLAVWRPGWLAFAARSRPLQAAALAGLLASLLLPGDAFREVVRYSLQGLALAVLLPAVAAPGPHVRLLAAAPAVWVGRLSYSLYLWHWGAYAVADRLAGPRPLPWLSVALPLAAVLTLASYYGIERPMLRWRRRAGSHAPLAVAEPAWSGGLRSAAS